MASATTVVVESFLPKLGSSIDLGYYQQRLFDEATLFNLHLVHATLEALEICSYGWVRFEEITWRLPLNRKDTLIAANLLTVLLFVLTSVKPAGAQNQTEAGTDASTANALRLETNVRIHGPGHVTGPSEPLIDGAQTPEAIPDRLVLRVLFQTIAIPPSPSAAERDRLRVRIGRMNLDESDIETLTQVVGRLSPAPHGPEGCDRRAAAASSESPQSGQLQLVRGRTGEDHYARPRCIR